MHMSFSERWMPRTCLTVLLGKIEEQLNMVEDYVEELKIKEPPQDHGEAGKKSVRYSLRRCNSSFQDNG